MCSVDGFRWFLLLYDAQHAVVKMLVEVLGVGEGGRTGGALARGILAIGSELLRGA